MESSVVIIQLVLKFHPVDAQMWTVRMSNPLRSKTYCWTQPCQSETKHYSREGDYSDINFWKTIKMIWGVVWASSNGRQLNTVNLRLVPPSLPAYSTDLKLFWLIDTFTMFPCSYYLFYHLFIYLKYIKYCHEHHPVKCCPKMATKIRKLEKHHSNT